MADFWSQRRDVIAQVLAHDGSSADVAQALRLLAGPLHYQAVVEGEPITSETIEYAVGAAASLARA